MKHMDGTLTTTTGIPGLYYQIWEPEKEIRSVIILIHGLGEHGGRYGKDFADFYTNSGVAILAPDLPGHGLTQGKQGHITDTALFLDYLDILIAKAAALYPGKAIFLYGHSMGGLITLWYTLARNPQVNGVIVTSPAIETQDSVPPIKRFLARIMNSVMPAFSMDNGLDANLLSHDKTVVQAYMADPLVHSLVSAKLGLMLISQGQWVLAHAAENKNDLLVMIGSREGIVSKDAVDRFCQTAPNVTYKIWPDLFHEIHNEPEKMGVFAYTQNWILDHIR